MTDGMKIETRDGHVVDATRGFLVELTFAGLHGEDLRVLTSSNDTGKATFMLSAEEAQRVAAAILFATAEGE